MSRPKLKQEPVTGSDLDQYLKTTDDFRLEIEVFRACQAAGMTASHGGSYRDPVTGLNRQYDVRAFYTENYRCIRFAIECKNLSECFPLLVSRMPRTVQEAFHTALVSRGGPGQSLYFCQPVKYAYFRSGGDEFVGKATTQVGRTTSGEFATGDSEVYEKWAQAIASAHDLVDQSVYDYKLVDSHFKASASVIQPILVVADKTLWVADYSEQGELIKESHQVDECSVFLKTEIPIRTEFGGSYIVSHLLIFTQSGFNAFLNRFRNIDFRERLSLDFSDLRQFAKENWGLAL